MAQMLGAGSRAESFCSPLSEKGRAYVEACKACGILARLLLLSSEQSERRSEGLQFKGEHFSKCVIFALSAL